MIQWTAVRILERGITLIHELVWLRRTDWFFFWWQVDFTGSKRWIKFGEVMKTEDIFVWQLFPLNSISKTRRRRKKKTGLFVRLIPGTRMDERHSSYKNTDLWVTVHWITMKICRIPYENAYRTGFRNLSNVMLFVLAKCEFDGWFHFSKNREFKQKNKTKKKKKKRISQESVKNWWCKRDANQNYINSYKWKGILRFIVWHEGFIQQIIRTKVIPQND